MTTDLIKVVARNLRYRPWDRLIGRWVDIADLAGIESAIRLALGADLPEECHLAESDPTLRQNAIAKYGILDLKFSASPEILAGEVRTGVPLLRELGFLPGGAVGLQGRVCDDPTCLEMLQEELAEERIWLLLFLKSNKLTRGKGEDTIPGSFRIVDACATNAPMVWLWKHFYL